MTTPKTKNDLRCLSSRESKGVLKFIDSLKKHSHVQQVILYGSRARGDFCEESDIDLLVVVKSDKPILKRKLSELSYDLSLRESITLHVRVIPKKEWQDPSFKTFLLVEKIQREGISLFRRTI